MPDNINAWMLKDSNLINLRKPSKLYLDYVSVMLKRSFHWQVYWVVHNKQTNVKLVNELVTRVNIAILSFVDPFPPIMYCFEGTHAP